MRPSILSAYLLALAACGHHQAEPAPASERVHTMSLTATQPPKLLAPSSDAAVPLGSFLWAQVGNDGGAADIAVDPPVAGASIFWDAALRPYVRWYPQPSQIDAGPIVFTLVGANPAGTSTVRFTASASSSAPGFPGLPKAKG
jgi:hypothetical protein